MTARQVEGLGLIARLEAATGLNRALDWEIHCRDGIDGVGMYGMHPNYTGSIDSALTLVPEGWSVLLAWNGRDCVADVHSAPLGTVGTWPAHASAKSIPLALTIATLRARSAP